MKKSVGIIFWFLFSQAVCLGISYESINQGKQSILLEKVYLNPDAIFLSSSGIETKLGNDSIKLDAIFVDAEGIFAVIPSIEAWKCLCGATNPDYNNICWSCHGDRPTKK